jgi:hypothetical protein
MALSKERAGEIAMLMLQHKLESDGLIRLTPKEIKRAMTNEARNIGIPVHEMAQFATIIFETAFEKTRIELDSIKAPQSEKPLPQRRLT